MYLCLAIYVYLPIYLTILLSGGYINRTYVSYPYVKHYSYFLNLLFLCLSSCIFCAQWTNFCLSDLYLSYALFILFKCQIQYLSVPRRWFGARIRSTIPQGLLVPVTQQQISRLTFIVFYYEIRFIQGIINK